MKHLLNQANLSKLSPAFTASEPPSESWRIRSFLTDTMNKFNTFYKSLDLEPVARICRTEGRLVRYDRGDTLVAEGQLCRVAAFIETGYFKYSVTNYRGAEAVIGFALPGEFAVDFQNGILGTPSEVSIVAGTACTVYQIPIERFRSVFADNSSMMADTLHALFRTIYTRYVDLYRLSPAERYRRLLTANQQIFEHVPLQELASYLGITPQYLSRLRRQK